MKGKGSGRRLATRVKTAKGRPISSTRWLQRQLNDPYVAEANRQGYRSRAAFKLTEIDDKLKLLKRGARVVDLGAAPGGWTQVAVQRVGGGTSVVALDILEMDPMVGAIVLKADFLSPHAPGLVKDALAGHKADLVLSDMAPSSSGQPDIDHLRIIGLGEAALELAVEVLAPGGAFVCKMRQGGEEPGFVAAVRRHFTTIRRIKPPASRPESAEFFVVGTGFKG